MPGGAFALSAESRTGDDGTSVPQSWPEMKAPGNTRNQKFGKKDLSRLLQRNEYTFCWLMQYRPHKYRSSGCRVHRLFWSRICPPRIFSEA